MATLAAARRAATLAGTPASSSSASLVPRRGFSGAADHHGPPKVNFWQDPTSPSKWKEEHFVIVSLTGWGLVFFSGYKFFTGGKKEEVLLYIPAISFPLFIILSKSRMADLCVGRISLSRECLRSLFIEALFVGSSRQSDTKSFWGYDFVFVVVCWIKHIYHFVGDIYTLYPL